MVEIIKEGKKPSDKSYEAKCRECETTFRFKRSEAGYVSDQRDGDALVIACPLCNARVWQAI